MTTLLAACFGCMLVGTVMAMDAWRELVAAGAVSAVILFTYYLLA